MRTPIKLRSREGLASGLAERLLGRAVFKPPAAPMRRDCFLIVTRESEPLDAKDTVGFSALLVEQGAESLLPSSVSAPVVRGCENLDFVSPNAIVALTPDPLSINVLYRPESPNNSIFATGRCNSNCIMCSQPPVISDDNSIVDEHLRLIDLIHDPPQSLGITGGEPTLLGDGLVKILERLRDRFPDTYIHMLTNGRLYAYNGFVRSLSDVRHPHFISAIPLYSDVASEHDYIVQAKGAFDQTISGFYNATRYGLSMEVRVVLHKQTIPRLLNLVEFIYRNLPFVTHIALMGLENMGYVKKNWPLLWIDPIDYKDTLERAVRHLYYRQMNVSVYNLPLCALPHSVWPFARQSISDYKNIYLDECQACDVKAHCSGLFSSSEKRHTRGLSRIQLDETSIRAIFHDSDRDNVSEDP